ncbi:MAG TPA: DUF6002 family protein, partial [Acidimicrobiales bacterium]
PMPSPATPATTTRNLIIDYQDVILAASAAVAGDPAATAGFTPGFDLPELTDQVRRFFAPAVATWRPLGEHAGHSIQLMDLTGNPGTQTTKTFASTVIVARAVEHIRRTGEAVCIFTPTSANKGIALRDAVGRALAAGLAEPDQLSVAVLAPPTTAHKFRTDPLAADPDLRARNPLLRLAGGAGPEEVKALGRAFVDRYGPEAADHGVQLWFSLDLRNYLVADAARAAFEADVAPTTTGRPRWHAHAVSSAYGLLGYNLGRDVLEAGGRADAADRPGLLLVQHLGTPDMVLSLRHGRVAREDVPTYRPDPTGVWRQDAAVEVDPRFPVATDDPAEVLDPTFYTHRPATSAAMNDLIRRHGGDGIVVSRRECEARYPQLRAWMAAADRPLPPDPGQLREWSLVMALTGVLNAIDRGLVPAGHEIVVHGSGSYAEGDYTVLEPDAHVATVDDIAAAVLPPRRSSGPARHAS